MGFQKYSVEDFVMNRSFRRWILTPRKEDNLHWEQWLRENPEKIEEVNEASKIVRQLQSSDFRLMKAEKGVLWDKISKDIDRNGTSVEATDRVFPINAESVIQKANRSKLPDRFFDVKRIAVAATFVLAITVAAFFAVKDWNQTFAPLEEEVAMVSKENQWGQKSTFFLSDGTEVKLNAGSSLIFPEQFPGDKREVVLTGEAFFEVAEDKAKPFSVVANHVVTTALGTSFNVSAYNANGVSVSLVSGKVKVAKDTDIDRNFITLEPGEQATVDIDKGSVTTSFFDMQRVVAWKNGIIYFDHASGEEVFTYLERWYGVEIEEANASVKEWNYSGSFDNMDLKNVLTAIGYSMNFEFSINNETVTVQYIQS